MDAHEGLEMKDEIKFKVQMKVSYMYDFVMRTAYEGMKGISGVIISVGAFILYINGYGGNDSFLNTMLIVITALMFVNPVFLYYRAAKQVKLSPVYQNPLYYTADATGITIQQGEVENKITWDGVMMVKKTRKNILVFGDRKHALIFPKEELGEAYEPFLQILKENLPEHCVKKLT